MNRLMKKLLWTTLVPLTVMALLTFGLTSLLLGRVAEDERYTRLEREADVVAEAIAAQRGIPRQLDVMVFQNGERLDTGRDNRMRVPLPPDLNPNRLAERDEVKVDGARVLTYKRSQGDVQIVTYTLVPFSNPQFQQIYLILAGGFVLALLVALLVTFWMSRRLTRPLLALKEATTSIVSGQAMLPLPPVTNDEIGDLTTAIEDMNRALEKKDTLQRTFISGITHDLRTPLAIVRTEAEMLELGILNAEEMTETGQSITEEVDRMDRLIRHMLEYAKDEAGMPPLERRPIRMDILVRTVVHRVESWFDKKKVRIHLRLEDVVVTADAMAMERILENLLKNAYEASPINGLVTVTVTENELSVQDEGPGIEESLRERIWELYAKGDRSNGYGLGLATTRRLAEAQGMTYGVQTEKGARFWISWT